MVPTLSLQRSLPCHGLAPKEGAGAAGAIQAQTLSLSSRCPFGWTEPLSKRHHSSTSQVRAREQRAQLCMLVLTTCSIQGSTAAPLPRELRKRQAGRWSGRGGPLMEAKGKGIGSESARDPRTSEETKVHNQCRQNRKIQ